MTTNNSLRIALVSFEFPPAVAIGGIGTYARELSLMLASAGHTVHVFSAQSKSHLGREQVESENIKIHRVCAEDRRSFRELVVNQLLSVHAARPFDLVESPEVDAEGLEVRKALPHVPMVVRLHSSNYWLSRLGVDNVVPFWLQNLRFFLGALRRGRFAWLRRERHELAEEEESGFVRSVDEVIAPSASMLHAVAKDWRLPIDKCGTVPLPYRFDERLLDIPVPKKVDAIGFLGRLETRKGIFSFARAIYPLLRCMPNLRARIIGPSWPTCCGDSREWLESYFSVVVSQVVFVGAISSDCLVEEIAKCSVVVLPSHWESFGMACAESMAAGRVVVGSSAGGMSDMLRHGENGFLVPPRSPRSIRLILEYLIDNPSRIPFLAANARSSIQRLVDPAAVLPLQLASYSRAIKRAKAGGA